MSEFVKVIKDGEIIEVHPDALADHMRLGWVVVQVEDDAKPASLPVEKPVKKKADK